ncbi:pyridoxal phosphate-dependent aminotransferase [Actinophytocola sp.]|uniref:pyridoxal phosphate-dependent aminotransferase n=1 Tax=Actinophytocola sp. TaxID=1872138 RepID=UPI003D6B71D3
MDTPTRPRVAARFGGLERSATMVLHDVVQELRAAGRSIVDLAKGEPDQPTPTVVTDAAITALRDGHTRYTVSRGIPELRAEIAKKLAADNAIHVDADDGVVVTPSGKHALFVAMMAILDPGDEIIVPSPGWVSYRAMAQLVGARAVPAELTDADGYRLTGDVLAGGLTERTKAVLVNTPNNPTGRVLDSGELDVLAEFVTEHDLLVITDEIYETIRFGGGPHLSVAARPECADRTLTVNGLSKSHAMTGWRLGYLAGPPDLMAGAVKVQEHTVSCATSFVQHAAVAALTGADHDVALMVAEYARRRDLVVSALDGLGGITCPAPDGTFYAFPDIRGAGHGESAEFAEWLLREAGVAIVPGPAFGPGGEGHMRLSFAVPATVLSDALERMTEALSSS